MLVVGGFFIMNFATFFYYIHLSLPKIWWWEKILDVIMQTGDNWR